jgi:hypothetical protein
MSLVVTVEYIGQRDGDYFIKDARISLDSVV